MKRLYVKPELFELELPANVVGCNCTPGGSAVPTGCFGGCNTNFNPPLGECGSGVVASGSPTCNHGHKQ
jgi:hypothetical protein